MLAKTSARHTGAEFVDFLAQIVVSQPAGREIHVIARQLVDLRCDDRLIRLQLADTQSFAEEFQ